MEDFKSTQSNEKVEDEDSTESSKKRQGFLNRWLRMRRAPSPEQAQPAKVETEDDDDEEDEHASPFQRRLLRALKKLSRGLVPKPEEIPKDEPEADAPKPTIETRADFTTELPDAIKTNQLDSQTIGNERPQTETERSETTATETESETTDSSPPETPEETETVDKEPLPPRPNETVMWENPRDSFEPPAPTAETTADEPPEILPPVSEASDEGGWGPIPTRLMTEGAPKDKVVEKETRIVESKSAAAAVLVAEELLNAHRRARDKKVHNELREDIKELDKARDEAQQDHERLKAQVKDLSTRQAEASLFSQPLAPAERPAATRVESRPITARPELPPRPEPLPRPEMPKPLAARQPEFARPMAARPTLERPLQAPEKYRTRPEFQTAATEISPDDRTPFERIFERRHEVFDHSKQDAASAMLGSSILGPPPTVPPPSLPPINPLPSTPSLTPPPKKRGPISRLLPDEPIYRNAVRIGFVTAVVVLAITIILAIT